MKRKIYVYWVYGEFISKDQETVFDRTWVLKILGPKFLVLFCTGRDQKTVGRGRGKKFIPTVPKVFLNTFRKVLGPDIKYILTSRLN